MPKSAQVLTGTPRFDGQESKFRGAAEGERSGGMTRLVSRSPGMHGSKRSFLVFSLMTSLGGPQLAAADPHTDYLLYCRGCHLHSGDAVPDANVPSLHALAPLLDSAEGREYIVRVPGVSQTPMNDERLAAVLNWVLAEFNSATLPDDFEPYSAEEVGIARKKVLADPLKMRAAILDAPENPSLPTVQR